MRKASFLCMAASLAAFIAIGCNESKPGGPGASQSSGKTLGKPEESFTISAPATAVNVKQGQKNEVKLSVKRGKDFKQDVDLTFEHAKGLKFTPSSVEAKASDKGDVTVEVLAEDEAPLGKQGILIRGKPKEGGSETTVTFDVNVEKK
jgi:uncharacterized membrane protein